MPTRTRRPLTELQQRVYEYLQEYVRETGRWPTYDRLKDHFGWSSPNSVTQILQALVEKGWLEKKDVGLYKFTTGTCPHCGQEID